MYPLSSSDDLSFFVGADLLQICVGKNEVILNFDKDVRVTGLSDFSVASPGGNSVRYEDPVEGAKALFGLLDNPVTRAEATDEGGLRLQFASGGVVTVLDTSRQYESFLIRSAEREIVV